jgi:hypothetical protein
MALAVAGALAGGGAGPAIPVAPELVLGYLGMVTSIGIRQIPHFRRSPHDLRRLPVFVLQLTFLMVPIRIAAFATMLHQGWGTRTAAPRGAIHEAPVAESAHV